MDNLSWKNIFIKVKQAGSLKNVSDWRMKSITLLVRIF